MLCHKITSARGVTGTKTPKITFASQCKALVILGCIYKSIFFRNFEEVGYNSTSGTIIYDASECDSQIVTMLQRCIDVTDSNKRKIIK